MKLPGPSQTPPAPARIWVLLASEASTAVIFRRGPTRWTRLYLWNTKTDEITSGSWFAGRLYELMSDLSPDGRHLTYVARNESKRRQEEAKELLGVNFLWSWTALCRPPKVKALGLWNASDLWSGGAIFFDNHTLELQHAKEKSDPLVAPNEFTVKIIEQSQYRSIMLTSMKRQGWRDIHLEENDSTAKQNISNLKKRWLALALYRDSKRRLVKEYSWHGPQPVPGMENASWADIDQQGRLVYARDGRLYAFVKDREIEIADFNLDQPPGRPEEKPTD